MDISYTFIALEINKYIVEKCIYKGKAVLQLISYSRQHNIY